MGREGESKRCLSRAEEIDLGNLSGEEDLRKSERRDNGHGCHSGSKRKVA